MKHLTWGLMCLVCGAAAGCDGPTTAKVILTVALNARGFSSVDDTVPTGWSGTLGSPAEVRRRPAVQMLVSALEEIDRLPHEAGEAQDDLRARLAAAIDRVAAATTRIGRQADASKLLVRQAREAHAVALDWAATRAPGEFTRRRDAYCQATLAGPWDSQDLETRAVQRMVDGILLAPELPGDLPEVLALHAAMFPRHAMNVEIYSALAERQVGVGQVLAGLRLAREGVEACAEHADVGRLEQRLQQLYRDHPGEVGVPMNFRGPTLDANRLTLSDLQGSPVLVVFWSTADQDSQAFLQRCHRLAEHFSLTGVELVGVSLRGSQSELNVWQEENGIHFPNLYAADESQVDFNNPIARFYRVSEVPQFFLLDQEGIVVARGSNDLGVIEHQLRRWSMPSRID